jgi:hypothetical protein
MAQVKKLSVATVYGAIDLKELLNAGRPLAVMHVGGTAVGTKTGQSPYGEWIALIGEFTAINAETGEMSEAAQLFLPEVALIPIQTALAREGARGVEFAITVYAQPSESKKPGGSPYEYTFENRAPMSENDPRAKMRALLQNIASGQQQLTNESAAPPAPAKKTAKR